MTALFGTDGVRGVAGEDLTEELASALGSAAAELAPPGRPQVLIVRDTRESGPAFERALAAGIAAAGGDVFLGGVLPTPAASIIVRRLGLDLAAVVSASHNPWPDNGIKFFGPAGTKLGGDSEEAIEARVAELRAGGEPRRAGDAGAVRALEGGLDDYLRALSSSFPLDLSGLGLIVDCANGATHQAAPAIFRRLGADVEAIADQPDGRNINEGCGSTHPEALAARVAESSSASIGFAFDGDGDRVVAVDGAGNLRDGDELIALAALHLADAGRLRGNGVAVTVMSNYGLHGALAGAGIEIATTDVGDKHVSAELERRDWALGGEQSGHVIWSDHAPTGDGLGAALLTLRALGGRPLADAKPFDRLPQVLENVVIADRDAVPAAAPLWAAVERENEALEGRGRVLVRPSGTEPLLRVMVEAPEEAEAAAVAQRLVQVVRDVLGA